MMKFVRCARIALCLLLFGASVGFAQESLEERPVEKKLSPAEVAIRQSTESTREAQAVFGLGVMRHRGDRWLEAVGLLEEAARLDPECPAANRALISLYLSLAREEDALDACRKVLHLDPKDGETAYQYAKLLKSEGNLKDAVAALTPATDTDRVKERPDLLYYMLNDLAEYQEQLGAHASAAVEYRRLANHLIEHKARLLGSDTLTVEQHATATARAFEKAGQCHLQLKQFDQALTAFLESRDFLAKHTDPLVRTKAIRLNWNLAQMCLSQERWKEALEYLDDYLENRPTDPEPYEKKLILLRKLESSRSIIPAMKRYAARTPDSLGIQLIYARELAALSDSRSQAEVIYLDLANRFGTVDVFRDLFRFYHTNDRVSAVISQIDGVLTILHSKDEIAADVRENARSRGRAMLTVLRGEPALVNAMLPVAVQELKAGTERMLDTWQLLGALAARAKQYDKAEAFFRKCLEKAAPTQEAAVYGGLLEVLFQQRQTDAVIALCHEALEGPKKAAAANELLFRRSLALAYSEREKPEEALAECDKAIKLAPETNKVFERSRKARILAKAERWDAAVAECESLLKDATQADEIKQVRNTLASIYTLKGDHEKAEAQLLKILADDPNDPGANNDLGYQWADRHHNLEQAEKMIRKAIEMDRLHRNGDPDLEPDNAAYLDSLGWVLFRQGKLEEARDWLEKASALSLGADDPTVWDHLGDVYLKLQMPSKARDSWQTAIKLYEHDKRGQKDGKLDEVKRKLKLVSK